VPAFYESSFFVGGSLMRNFSINYTRDNSLFGHQHTQASQQPAADSKTCLIYMQIKNDPI